MNKYINYVIFLVLLLLFFVLQTSNKISTNITSILPESQNKELLQIALMFEQNKKLFVAVKGTSKESLQKLKMIEKDIAQIDGIKKQQLIQNKKLIEFKQKYHLYLNQINIQKLDKIDIQSALQKLYYTLFDPFMIPIIDKNDPLHLCEKEIKNINLKNGKLLLQGYGYLSVFTINNSINMIDQYAKIYDAVHTIERDKDIKTFSSIYYFVENSRYIKKDATTIAFIAMVLLLSLYIVILKNITLLVNTLLTLGSSALISSIIVTTLYTEISIFVLVFGISISTIAIDYMFHHYFHNKYLKYSGVNKEVFFGFLTTFGVFFIFSFSDFLLIQQIALFTLCSLLFSYLLFSFLFPFIGFVQKEKSFSLKQFSLLNNKGIFILSLGVLIISILNLKFDFDIATLNYDNKPLQQKEQFFKKGFNFNDKIPFLLKANSIEELIDYNEKVRTIDPSLQSSLNSLISKKRFLEQKEKLENLNLKELQKDINEIAHKIGFKKDYFKDSYNYDLDMPRYSFEILKEYGIDVNRYKNGYISYILVSKDKVDQIAQFNFIYSLSMKKLFENYLQDEFTTLTKLGVIAILFIFVIVGLLSKKRFLNSFNFLLFPSSVIFFYFLFIEVNILHLFMFFIILAISIDYGIYLSKRNDPQTQKAVLFSALSSFAGFGVLIFSSTTSLYSIGSVATLGIIAILILIFFTKAKYVS